jgi:fibronectin-binding autotransporter adhesin
MKNKRVIGRILGAATVFVAVDSARAATYYWDADANASNNVANGPSGGTGTWNATNTNWYNGAAPATEVVWADGNDAVFAGTGGTVTISPPANTTFSPGKLTISSDGYVFSGTLAPTDAVAINANIQTTNFRPTTSTNTVIASGKTLTFASGTNAPRLVTGGSIAMTGGSLSAGNIVLNSALTQTGGTASASASGNTPTIGLGAVGSWTLNHSAAVLTIEKLLSSQQTPGVNFDVGSGNSGNGTLTVNAGTVSVINGAVLRIGFGSASSSATTTGSVNIAGGTLTVTGSNPFTGVNSTVYIVDSGNGVNAALAVSGGTATIDAIQFGRAAATGQGALNVSAGSLYVGFGGITTGTLPTANATITLSGGTVGAAADWSSSMAMTVSGSTTIKAADSSGTAHNISLSGNLSGNGSLTKSGGGKLTLGSAGYTGATRVTAGVLEVNGTLATNSVTVDSGTTLQGTGVITNSVSIAGHLAPAGAGIGKLTAGSATFGTGSSLDINLSASSVSDVLAITGALDISNVTLNLSGTADSTTYVIATYAGTLTGSFFDVPIGYTIDYGTRQNSKISVTAAVPEPVVGAFLPGMLLLLGRRSRRTR